jgi:hypothetical protein
LKELRGGLRHQRHRERKKLQDVLGIVIVLADQIVVRMSDAPKRFSTNISGAACMARSCARSCREGAIWLRYWSDLVRAFPATMQEL